MTSLLLEILKETRRPQRRPIRIQRHRDRYEIQADEQAKLAAWRAEEDRRSLKRQPWWKRFLKNGRRVAG